MTTYYQTYLAVAVLAAAAAGMFGAMLGVGRLLRPNRPQDEKYITYEAGSDPVSGFGQSNIRYYVYALLFVMFDVEAVFIFPWALSFVGIGPMAYYEMLVFVGILAAGLAYAWKKGALKWQ